MDAEAEPLIHDSPEWRAVRDEKLEGWIGDQPAMAWFLEYCQFCEVIDDLIDRDKPIREQDVVNLLFTAFVELPANTFYQHFGATLAPVIVAGINAWLDSNNYERGKSLDDRIRAYMLRDRYMEVLATVIYLLHGPERMRELSMEIRDFFQAETFEEYVAKAPLVADAEAVE